MVILRVWTALSSEDSSRSYEKELLGLINVNYLDAEQLPGITSGNPRQFRVIFVTQLREIL